MTRTIIRINLPHLISATARTHKGQKIGKYDYASKVILLIRQEFQGANCFKPKVQSTLRKKGNIFTLSVCLFGLQRLGLSKRFTIMTDLDSIKVMSNEIGDF